MWILVIHNEGYAESPRRISLIEPREPFARCLGILVHTKRIEHYLDPERAANHDVTMFVRFSLMTSRSPVMELIAKTSDALVWISGNALTMNMELPDYLPVVCDLVPASDPKALHVNVNVESKHPAWALAPARTAVNQLLDTLMRVGWVPLVIMRLDLDKPLPPLFGLRGHLPVSWLRTKNNA